MDSWLWDHERLLNKMLMEKCMNESGWHLKSWWTLVSQKEGKPGITSSRCDSTRNKQNPQPLLYPKYTLVIIKSQPWICAGLCSSDQCIQEILCTVYTGNTVYSVYRKYCIQYKQCMSKYRDGGAFYMTLQKYNQQNPECGQFLSMKTLFLQ